MKEIEVVRSSELNEGYSTPGIVRAKAFESVHRFVIVSRTTVARGAVSDWHHHGKRHLYGFLESGHMRLEYGVKGASAVEVGKGDFFHIPPDLVHRDVNPDKEQALVVVNILVGRGDPVINVKRPKQA
jgi:uncharacterized RmlC-like cupin family protein